MQCNDAALQQTSWAQAAASRPQHEWSCEGSLTISRFKLGGRVCPILRCRTAPEGLPASRTHMESCQGVTLARQPPCPYVSTAASEQKRECGQMCRTPSLLPAATAKAWAMSLALGATQQVKHAAPPLVPACIANSLLHSNSLPSPGLSVRCRHSQAKSFLTQVPCE